MSNTSFPLRHILLLSANFSQSHATSCLSRMSHHWVNSKCNRVKGQHWRWLIYAHITLCNNMLHVFRSNHHCSWKFQKFHRKTPVLESLFCNRSIVILQKTLLWIFGKWFMKMSKKTKTFHNKHLLKLQTDILKFFEALFCTYCKGLFCV